MDTTRVGKFVFILFLAVEGSLTLVSLANETSGASEAGNSSQITVGASCPQGQGIQDGICQLCPLGTYSDFSVCQNCPVGTSTTSTGSRSVANCSRDMTGVPTWYIQVLVLILMFVRIMTLFIQYGVVGVVEKKIWGMGHDTRQTFYLVLAALVTGVWILLAVPKVTDTADTNYKPAFFYALFVTVVLFGTVIHEIQGQQTGRKWTLMFNFITNLAVVAGAFRAFILRREKGRNDMGITVILFISIQLALFNLFEVLKVIGERSKNRELMISLGFFFAFTILVFVSLPGLFLFGLYAHPDNTIEQFLFAGIDTSLSVFGVLALAMSFVLQFIQTLHESHSKAVDEAKFAFDGIYQLQNYFKASLDCDESEVLKYNELQVRKVRQKFARFLDKIPTLVCPFLGSQLKSIDSLRFMLGHSPSEHLTCSDGVANTVLAKWREPVGPPESINCEEASALLDALNQATITYYQEQNMLSPVSVLLRRDYANVFIIQLFVANEMFSAISSITKYGMDSKLDAPESQKAIQRWLFAFSSLFVICMVLAILWQLRLNTEEFTHTLTLWDEGAHGHKMTLQAMGGKSKERK